MIKIKASYSGGFSHNGKVTEKNNEEPGGNSGRLFVTKDYSDP
jgi:hypothetical protein